jgi:hypothetical protein
MFTRFKRHERIYNKLNNLPDVLLSNESTIEKDVLKRKRINIKYDYQNIIAWIMSTFLLALLIWALSKIFKGEY